MGEAPVSTFAAGTFPVPQQMAHGDAQATPDERPSPQKPEVPIPRVVQTPLPAASSPRPKENPPDAQMLAKAAPLAPATLARPLVSRHGWPIIPPRGLMDYVPSILIQEA